MVFSGLATSLQREMAGKEQKIQQLKQDVEKMKKENSEKDDQLAVVAAKVDIPTEGLSGLRSRVWGTGVGRVRLLSGEERGSNVGVAVSRGGCSRSALAVHANRSCRAVPRGRRGAAAFPSLNPSPSSSAFGHRAPWIPVGTVAVCTCKALVPRILPRSHGNPGCAWLPAAQPGFSREAGGLRGGLCPLCWPLPRRPAELHRLRNQHRAGAAPWLADWALCREI